jgi:1,4-dihydroxy-2-naphthoate octaprenyltransferase
MLLLLTNPNTISNEIFSKIVFYRNAKEKNNRIKNSIHCKFSYCLCPQNGLDQHKYTHEKVIASSNIPSQGGVRANNCPYFRGMKPDSGHSAQTSAPQARSQPVSHLARWLSALRLRTLPLALSGVGMGNLLAWQTGSFDGFTAATSLSTAALLQILSNLANDLGDATHGADGIHRVGPARAVAGGAIAASDMRMAVRLLVVLSVAAGLTLLFRAHSVVGMGVWLMLAVGLTATWAAIRYTMGEKPYGYAGYGDVAVWLFFGPTAVLGTAFLHSGRLEWPWMLPAIGLGCLSTAVLNLNNLRDREGDARVGKRTQVVRMGPSGGLLYQVVLVGLGVGAFWGYALCLGEFNLLLAWTLPGLVLLYTLTRLYRIQNPTEFDPWLGRTAGLTFLFVVLFVIWQWMH